MVNEYCYNLATPFSQKHSNRATKKLKESAIPKTMIPSSSKMHFEANFGEHSGSRAVVSTGNLSLTMQLNLKQLKLWFSTWHDWKKRVAVCRIIENCTKANLECLATSLEPILHLDFSTSLSPLMAAVHHEGSRTFRIQRAADYTLPSTVMPPQRDEPLFSESFTRNLQTIPPPYLHSESNFQVKKQFGYFSIPPKPEPVFLPAIDNTHSKHKLSPASSDFGQSTITQRSSSIELSPLRRPYNSVPDIRSTVDLLKMAKHHNSLKRNRKRKHQPKSLSFAHLENKKLLSQRKHRQLELYKSQLNWLSEVSINTEASKFHVANVRTLYMCFILTVDKAVSSWRNNNHSFGYHQDQRQDPSGVSCTVSLS